ncbi:flagellar hook-basal body complex protein FliE [Sporohalobacter salinus]|uniref:flagellar hook-basal body complex protein FliE n=1 Tax=Sporohalobacter salinus TaxID=1494606 RepID=UPI00195F35A5|nr:flagellar hook-basal body complex protein FliE [Sporohalobacter salinus]MBM7623526.1 flagellar hook-basal body complex protein FliE [Sporohalobacter salinus]
MKSNNIQSKKLLQPQNLNKNNKLKKDKSFQEVFSNALNKVNNLQKKQDIMSEKLATGEVENVHQVMMSATKAKLSLDLTLQIRNKIVESYKEIMRMQV